MLPRKKIPRYDDEQREALRRAGQFNAQLMDYLRPFIQPGITTDEINTLTHDYTVQHGHKPAPLNYRGFPKSVCTSINNVVCHGIPDNTVLRDGDIINVDITTIVDGWYGDQSETFLIGNVSSEALHLVQVTFDALHVGIRAAQPGKSILHIGQAIYDFTKDQGVSIVREYQGHGIGHQFHQAPGVPHFPDRDTARDILHPGMCLTIEPMLNLGTWETMLDRDDGWTVRTRDGRLSAQFEHTVLITEAGPEILTLTQDGPQEGHQFVRTNSD